MNVYLTALALLVALLLQTSLLVSWGAPGWHLDVVLLLIVGIGVVGGATRAVVWSLVAGLLLDVTSVAPLGTNLLALLPVALLTTVRDTNLVEGKLTLALALAFGGTLLYTCMFLLVLQATGRRVDWLGSLWWVALPSAVLNTVVMPLVYWVARGLALPHLVRKGTFIRP
ncbi:MAG: rod shape-determining protein MreD [Chloroflexi bacterium]|nr:rod shape-determining protein MreD [Chloroflexota bacterium]